MAEGYLKTSVKVRRNFYDTLGVTCKDLLEYDHGYIYNEDVTDVVDLLETLFVLEHHIFQTNNSYDGGYINFDIGFIIDFYHQEPVTNHIKEVFIEMSEYFEEGSELTYRSTGGEYLHLVVNDEEQVAALPRGDV